LPLDEIAEKIKINTKEILLPWTLNTTTQKVVILK
jgi:hypothetical protein